MDKYLNKNGCFKLDIEELEQDLDPKPDTEMQTGRRHP